MAILSRRGIDIVRSFIFWMLFLTSSVFSVPGEDAHSSEPAPAREAVQLPTFAGPTPGTLREITIPLVDISKQKWRHSIVARGTDAVYHGHCDTVLLPDGKTMFTAWTVDHAQACGTART